MIATIEISTQIMYVLGLGITLSVSWKGTNLRRWQCRWHALLLLPPPFIF